MDVFITGIGVISALGKGTEANLNTLLSEKSGIELREFKELKKKFFAGTVKNTNEELASFCGVENPNISRTSLLAINAATECWGDNNIIPELKTGIISGTSVGGMDRSELYFQDKIKENKGKIAQLMYHDSGNTTEQIARHFNIRDYINTLSTACSSSSNSMMHAARLIESGKLDRVLAGGSDSLTGFTISGFNSLMVYSDDWCKPFDKNRQGLNLGEGAAYLLLESEKSLQYTKNKILGVLSGWGNKADAFHQTATSSSGTGAIYAMQEALKKAALQPSEIDYINTHGTSTKNNDVTESTAMKTVFQDKIPAFSSTKSYTGHTLAASGAIEAVFSILAMQNNILLPNLNFKEPIEETGLVPVTHLKSGEQIHHVLNNSFGFGGNCTSLIISRA